MNLEPKHQKAAAFYGSVLAASTGLRGGEIKKLRIGALDLENRRLRIRRADTKSDAGARTVELNRDATEAAARLLVSAGLLKPPANEPQHYLMPKHLSRIAHGEHKGERGYVQASISSTGIPHGTVSQKKRVSRGCACMT